MAPENTLASFQAAIDAGADMLELDVTLSRDGVPIVIHDATLNRTTSGEGRVSSKPIAELRKLSAGSWFSKHWAGEPIPVLENVLRMAKGKTALNIEIKKEAVGSKIAGGIEESVVDLVGKHKLSSRVVISSFSKIAVQRIKKISSIQSTALLLPAVPQRFSIASILDVQADALHISPRGLTQKFVAELKQKGVPIRVYTINQTRQMQKLIRWQVDGIFTDDVRRLRAALD